MRRRTLRRRQSSCPVDAVPLVSISYGPCAAAPWYVELGATDHPVTVVERIVRTALGNPKLIHSTSWRRDRDAVILSFVVVIDAAKVGTMDSVAIGRTALARSEATAAPR